MKLVLVPTPAGPVRVLVPVADAPAGTVNTRLVPVLFVMLAVASTPFRRKLLSPVRLPPATVTRVPATPLLGVKLTR